MSKKLKEGEYVNASLRCEAGGCEFYVARSYRAFCDKCFKKFVAKGSFKSRDGHTYKYDGSRFIQTTAKGSVSEGD